MKHYYTLLVFLILGSFGFAQGGHETFDGLTPGASNYAARAWTGQDGSPWSAGASRTDETITGKAITMNSNVAAFVESGTLSGGIGDLTITTQRKFGGSNGDLTVLINNIPVGTVPYGSAVQTTTLSGIDIPGDFVIRINNDIPTLNRVAVDDIIWTGHAAAPTTGSLVIGTGDTNTTTYEATPIHGYYSRFRYQVVYTAAELSTYLNANDEITDLGWSIAGDYGGGDLLGYTIKMGHTSATNSTSHDASSTIVVKNPFNYNPTVTPAGEFDMIPFDINFVWNGVDNILVDICSDGANPFTSPYGQVRANTVTNGSRFYRSDSGTACNTPTDSTTDKKPQVQFNYLVGIPPTCPTIKTLTVSAVSDTTANINWNPGDNETNWEIAVQATGLGEPTGSGTPVLTNSYLAAGLSIKTNYEVYVRANCTSSNDGYGVWVGPIAFKTTAVPVTDFPYYEDFESGDGDWTADNTTNGSWDLGVPTNTFINSAASGANAWVTNLTGSYNNSEKSSVVSPPFDFSNLNAPVIEFSIWWQSEFSWDGAVLQSSIDGGTSWQNVGAYNDPNNWYNDNTINGNPGGQQIGWTGRISSSNGSNGWLVAKNNLLGLAGQPQVFLRVAFGSDGSGQDNGFAFDSINIYDPSCPDVSNLSVSTITPTEATINWDEGLSETAWEIVVQTQGSPAPTGAGTAITTKPHIALGLTANTSYDVYVRANCDTEGFSAWVGPVTFTTNCSVISTLPFTENVETTSNTLSCWGVIDNNSDGDTWTINTTGTYANSGSRSFAITTDFNDGANDDYLISPQIHLSGYEQLKFYQRVRSAAEPHDFTVLLSTTGFAPADFTHTILPIAAYSNTTYQEITVNLSAHSGDVYIAFHVPPGGLDGWILYLDDITVESLPDCPNIADLTIDSFTDSEVLIDWSPGYTETSWEVAVQTAGTGIPTGNGTAANSHPHTASGLTGNTNYEVYVRADCTANDDGYSEWIGPVTFTTKCESITSFPYLETFEGITSGQPECWNIEGTTTNSTYHFSSFLDGYAGRGMRFNSYLNSSGLTSELITPPFDASALASLELNFYYKNPTAGNFEVLVSSDGGANYDSVGDELTDQTDWTLVTYDLSSYISSTMHIKFKGTSNYANGDAYVYLDEMLVREIPTCPDITSFEIDSFTDSEVTLNWTGSTETAWQVIVQPVGDPMPTSGMEANAYPHTESGLTNNTLHEAYVRADCTASDDGYGAWSGPLYFTTWPAPVTDFPYYEDFEAGPGDWSANNDANGSWQWGTPNKTNINSADSGTKAWITRLTGVYNAYENSWVTSPPFNFTNLVAPVIELSIWWETEYSYDGAALQSSIDGGLTWQNVGAYNDPYNWYNDDTITGSGGPGGQQTGWTGRGTANGSEGWVVAKNTLTGLGGQAQVFLRIAFASDVSSQYEGFAFDTVSIHDPSCPDITDLAVNNVTDTEATFAWADGDSETAWEIMVQAPGSPAPTGSGTAITSNPHIETGLTPSTSYEAYVRADCETSGFSAWIGPVHFSTTSVPITDFPYNEDFEVDAGNWTASTSGSWDYGVPLNTHINSADSGTKAWVTNLTGPYNNSENSSVTSPAFDFTNLVAPVIELSVWWQTESGWDGAVLQSSINGGSTWQNVGALGDANNWYNHSNIGSSPGGQKIGWSGRNAANGSNGWRAAKNNLTGLGGKNGVLLRVAFSSDSGVNDEGFAFDTIHIYDPSCPDITDLVVDSFTETEATFIWAAGSSETDWEIAIQAQGTAKPTGAGIAVATNTYTATDLLGNRSYDVYVRAQCAVEDFSDWVGPVSFSTPCPIAESSFPYTEGFESSSLCWTTQVLSGTGGPWSRIASGGSGDIPSSHSGSGFMEKNFSPASDAILVSPAFDLSNVGSDSRIKVWLFRQDYGNDNDKYIIYANTSASITGAEQLLEVHSKRTQAPAVASKGWYEYTMTIPSSFNTSESVYIIIQGITNSGAYDLGVDDFTIEPVPTCTEVSDVSIDSFTDSEVTLSWTPGGTETDWEVAVQTAGAPAPTSAGTATITNTLHTETGLTAQTAYDIYVRADCGNDDLSPWIGPLTFTTACAGITDFSENFDTVSTPNLPNCWSRITDNNASSFATVTTSTTNHSAPNGVSLYNSDSPADANIMLVSPNLANLSDGTHLLRFFARNSIATQDLEIGTLSNPTDGSTFTVLTTVDINTSFAEYEVSFAGYSGTDSHIAIRRLSTSTYTYVYLDDIVWEPLPACPKITNLTIDSATATSANISWAAGHNETNWEVAVQEANTGEPTAAGTATSSTTYTEMGLLPNTAYEVYVRAACDANEFSEWVGPVNFTTACEAITVYPFIESFEGITSGQPECWGIAGTTTNASYHFSSFATGSTGKGMRFNSWNNPNGLTSELITPLFDASALTTLQLEFNYKNPTGGDFEVLISSDGGANYIPLATGLTNQSSWTPMVFNITTHISENLLIKFKGTSNYGSDDAYVYLDEVKISEMPSCPDVTDLIADSVAETEATIIWTAGNTETNWEIVVQNQGTGTPTTAGIATTANTYTALGLTGSTTYDVYVRANCGTEDFSEWVGPLSFTTSCPPTITTFPYTEGFESSSLCWTTQVISGTGAWNRIPTGGSGDITAAHSGSGFMEKNYTNSDAILISPQFDLTNVTGDSRIKVWLYRQNYGSDDDKYIIHANTSGSLTGATQLLEIHSKRTIAPTVADKGWYEYTMTLPSNFNTNASVYIIIQGITTAGFSSYDLGVDDFTLEAMPECLDVSALTVADITGSEATFNWTPGGTETDWEIAVQTAGTGTPSGAGTAISNNSHTETGLSSLTNYEVYVRANCDINGFSPWVGPVSFTTECGVYVPDYLEDFTTIPADCWKKAGGGTAATGPTTIGGGQWIADGFLNNGTTGAYRINLWNNTKSDWILSPQFDLTGGPFQVEFDFGIMRYGSSTLVGTLGSDDTVQLLISADNGDTWTPLITYDNTSVIPVSGTHPIYNLSAYSGQTVQFGILASEGSVYDPEDIDVFVDNFEVREVPACPDVTNLTAHSIYGSEASFSWTPGGSETDWEITVQEAGTTAPTGPGTGTTTNAYTETGLTPLTNYEVYVRANCDTEGFSAWIGPVNFTTGCASITAFPYLESFENITWGQPECWSIEGTTITETYHFYSFATGSTGKGMRFNSYINGSGNTSELITPLFDASALTTLQLEFNYKNPAGGNFEVLVSSDGGANYVSLQNGLINQSDWTPMVFNLTTHISNQLLIKFKGTSNYGPSGAYIDLDEVKISEMPSCPDPTDLIVDSIGRNHAFISWEPGNTETDWEIAVQTAGTGAPTAAGTPISTNTYEATGLLEATDYEVYVRANCDVNDLSGWVGPVNFRTSNPLPITAIVLDVDGCGTSYSDSYNGAYDAAAQNVVWAQLNYSGGCDELIIDTIGSDFDTEIGIYDDNGNLIGSNDSGGAGINPQSLYTAAGLADGTYYIAAGRYNVTYGPGFTVTSSNSSQVGTLFINARTASDETVDYCNLQFPNSGTIVNGGSYTAYAQIFKTGVTETQGQGANIAGWIGYSTTNATTTADFTSSNWTWVEASYNGDIGNNDEYEAEIGSGRAAGLYYYVSRFSVNGGPFAYGGITPNGTGGDFWNGTTAVSGELTVHPPTPTVAKTITINGCNDSDFYSGAYNASTAGVVWVELIYDGGCTEITVDTEGTGFDTEIGLYDAIGNLIGEDDDGGTGSLSLLTEQGLPAGTYYIAAGRWNVTFGANFNASSSNTSQIGVIRINASTPNMPDYVNLQYPSSGTINPGDAYDVYAQIYEAGVTDVAGQSTNIQAWIGYSTTNATTTADFTSSNWTWVPATYNTDIGNNEEYQADIGSTLAPDLYYYVSRFTIDSGPYAYGGINPSPLGDTGGFWDGSTYNSGELTVNPNAEPTNHVLNFTAVADSQFEITLTWDDNDGAQPADGFLILGKTGTASFMIPTDGTYPANDTDWADDSIVVSVASGVETYTVTGLEESTLYEFEIYPYTNPGSMVDFKTDDTIPFASATTLDDPCSIAITSFPFTEGFEEGALPSCWSQEAVAGTGNWTFNNGASGGVITSAHSGSYNALFYDTTSSAVHKLVTPPLDLTGLTNPTLSFWHAQEEWFGDEDELRVYYKTSAGGAWTLIPGQEYTSSISSWTLETMDLPNPSTEYYIAFEGTGAWARGIALDDVTIEENPCIGPITTFPFTEGFEGTGFPPQCWSTFIGANGLGTAQNWTRNTSTTHTGNGSASVRWESVTGGNSEDWLVTPALDLSALSAPELTFYAREEYSSEYGNVYTIRVSTTDKAINSFTTVETYTEADMPLVFTQFTVDLSAYASDSTVYIAFVMTQNSGDTWYLDDIKVDDVLPITYTYNGSWSPSNPNGVATDIDDIVVVSGDASIFDSTVINSVTVNPGAGLTINSSSVTLTVVDALTLESSSTSYSSLILNGTIAGTVKYERYVNANSNGNDLVSPPLVGQSWTDFLNSGTNAADLMDNGQTGPTLYAFGPFDKAVGAYVNYSDTSMAYLDSAKGYRAATDSGTTLTFTGSVPTTAVAINITNSGPSFQDWNLIGNPYPSYISMADFLNYQIDAGARNIDLLANASGIYGYDGDASTGWDVVTLANAGARLMTPGQGFFVAADAAYVASHDITFATAMRTTGSDDDFIAGRNADVLTYLKLNTSTSTKAYTTQFYFDENASQGVDHGYDAKLWGDTPPSFALYSHLVQENTGVPMALQALNPSDMMDVVIPLGVNANAGEQLTFTISESSLPSTVQVYLEDELMNTSTLLNASDYILTPSSDLNGVGRFYLRVSDGSLSNVKVDLNAIKIYTTKSPRSIFISGALQGETTAKIYDLQGRLINSIALEANSLINEIDATDLLDGVYVITLSHGEQQKSQKIIIR